MSEDLLENINRELKNIQILKDNYAFYSGIYLVRYVEKFFTGEWFDRTANASSIAHEVKNHLLSLSLITDEDLDLWFYKHELLTEVSKKYRPSLLTINQVVQDLSNNEQAISDWAKKLKIGEKTLSTIVRCAYQMRVLDPSITFQNSQIDRMKVLANRKINQRTKIEIVSQYIAFPDIRKSLPTIYGVSRTAIFQWKNEIQDSDDVKSRISQLSSVRRVDSSSSLELKIEMAKAYFIRTDYLDELEEMFAVSAREMSRIIEQLIKDEAISQEEIAEWKSQRPYKGKRIKRRRSS